MAYDLEEQEQLATLKAWWNTYGNLVTWLLVLALAAFSGWTYYNNDKRSKALEAATLYQEMDAALNAKDAAKINRVAQDMQTRFAATPYAVMASLRAAKAAFDANDLKTAKSMLQWVVTHEKEGEALALARLRLAGVLLDEKAYDEGMKQLSAEFPPAFAAQVADRKGDILLAQGKTADARAAFEEALKKTGEKDALHQLLKFKLDALGGAKA
ncbi:tetratricopeptide repeat protein [Massilia sp. W12]|uniref:YfgM family protein n=1 Tax=Massilia sp. W12 TaxID=3126507 RepID=UPI0030CDC70C